MAEQMGDENASDDLAELLEETRILLPGSEVLVAFLISLPFTERFEVLTSVQLGVFLATFFTSLAALICFVMPAAYHRLARPIRKRGAFKVLANRLLIAGLIPLSFSLPLATYLVTSLAATNLIALVVSAVVVALIATLWWVLPLVRAHDRCRPDESPARSTVHSEA
jgi:hypothetical protein